MRDFKKTAEPQGGRPTPGGNSFVVQKHAARRLHYDFRLELDGALKSWAVTRGPSFDPADRRLAVHVEDHPIDYAGFEGIIPQGEYGGGTVMVWDRGTWEPIGDPRAGYAKGKLKFKLHGDKLKGGWTLVRMGGRARQERTDNWLLIKERDEEARPGHGDEVLEKRAKSVTTGRSLDQIASSADRVWTREGEQTVAKPKVAKPAARPAPKRKKKQAAGGLPDFVPPELPTLVDAPPEGPEWLHEIKLDGYRVLWRIADGRARFLTRTGQDWTAKFPELARVRIKADTALIDGEIVANDEKGVSSFQALQEALSAGRTAGLKLCAFDLLYLNDEDLRTEPLEARKARLKALLKASPASDRLTFSEHIDGRGRDVFANACNLSLEGIVSKRRDAPYRPGRGEDWLKTKCGARQEFVIGGFTEHSKEARSIGALLIGYYEDEDLLYAGKVGTGFDAAMRKQLRKSLDELPRKDMPFKSVPSAGRRGAHWVKPQLVAEVAYTNWTRDGVLRHPSFQGLRMDKPAKAISRDRAKPVAKSARGASRPAKGRDEIAGVTLTHPDRVLYADQGLTKRDLAAYYMEVADAMLPHLAGRPLSLVRCPDGEGKACFYQKHPGNSAPPALRRIKISEGSGTNEYVVVDDAAGLVALVQMGVLEVHPWGSTEKNLEKPDRIIFDFDPAPDVDWKQVVAAAAEMRARLQALGLESFLKTTGGKGLHVVAPIAPRDEWPEVKAFTKAVAMSMERDSPDAYTTVMSKKERKGRIFIDYLRNDRGSTAIAPYSTRARAGAPVAMPIPWKALTPGLKPSDFTVLTVPKKLKAQRADPWAGIGKLRQGITAKAKAAVGLK